jgi:hypothetical protein
MHYTIMYQPKHHHSLNSLPNYLRLGVKVVVIVFDKGVCGSMAWSPQGSEPIVMPPTIFCIQ